MLSVHILIREDFANQAKKLAHDSIARSLDAYPDLGLSPYPSTTRQHGIFNVACCLLGFNMAQIDWDDRQISTLTSIGIQQHPEVSHTSVTLNAAPLLIGPKTKIEGLDITRNMHLDTIHVTTHFDAHRGVVKSYKKLHKEGRIGQSHFDETLRKERARFDQLQSIGLIPSNFECRC